MAKPDITTDKLESWDMYKARKPDEIIEAVYMHIEATSRQMCAWYWSSIRTKRWTSLQARALALLFLVIGTTLPLLAALQERPDQKLLLTQLAVASLVLAGLAQLADRIFGWSSGWMRYIATVTTMENLTRAFQMEWGKYLVAKTEPIEAADARALFDLARGLEQELTKLQAEETTKWVAEFNTGIELLDTMIKTQREETDKKLEAIRTSLTSQESAAKSDQKAKIPGALEVTLTFKADARPIKIGLDSDTPADFLGNFWTRIDVPPGRHVVRVITSSQPPRTIERIAEVEEDALTKVDVAVGE
jgi:hypothetical protein